MDFYVKGQDGQNVLKVVDVYVCRVLSSEGKVLGEVKEAAVTGNNDGESEKEIVLDKGHGVLVEVLANADGGLHVVVRHDAKGGLLSD